jgi:hypothetical protein
METARYLPASRVKAGSLRLGRLTVRSTDGRELGKLMGFVIERGDYRIRSLVVESVDAQVEVPMGPLQFDAAARSLRLIGASTTLHTTPFLADRLPVMEDDDLWVPFFHTAA